MEELAVDWARAQFALTAIYHWLFVPLTLGLGYILGIMEYIYLKTGDEFWKKTTQFWMKLFAINFAIGVATGLIMEFEFGTNWSNYSWFVGDIFGAPLAIEGILAFFMESTFFAVMFFGWEKVSKRFHLLSTCLVTIGSNLSALWILVANGWMQHPVGMKFNPDTVRNEMDNFWEVALSSTAINKFLHTIINGMVIASLFVVGISCYYLLKKKKVKFAKASIKIAAIFGLVSSLLVMASGDLEAREAVKYQPYKLAAMEGLYDGHDEVGIVVLGVLNPDKKVADGKDEFLFKVELPYLLSFLAHHQIDSFVAGFDELIHGDKEHGIEPAKEKIRKGKIALQAFKAYKEAKKQNDTDLMAKNREILEKNMPYFGYGYIKNVEDLIPNVALVFYAFHIMVGLGTWFFVFFALVLFFLYKKDIEKARWLLWLGILSIPLGYIASECGWIVAEVGRQPWIIQDLMPTNIANTTIETSNVQISFFLFLFLFTALLIAEIKIMLNAIKKGPEGEENV